MQNSKNSHPPQIDTDRAAGKHSFAVRYGAARTRQTARWLTGIFLISTGLGLLLGESRPLTLLVFAIVGLAAIARLWRAAPNPKRILLPSSGIILASLIAQSL